MLSPRWRKVLRDLWGNKIRTLLVVLSIAVGVFAIGMIAGSRVILLRDVAAAYAASSPSSATLYTAWFDDDLVQVVRHMPGVREAEGRHSIGARLKIGPDEWRPLQRDPRLRRHPGQQAAAGERRLAAARPRIVART
jgi:putative ABC transport system permease protein